MPCYRVLGLVENTSDSDLGKSLRNVSVILVKTLQPGNIGSVARAMDNMGLRRLLLVAPAQEINDECRRMAGKSIWLVEDAPRFANFDSAVADEHMLVAATSARNRHLRRPICTPREAAPLILARARKQRVSLVFGPEQTGLTSSQLARCQLWVSIPANSAAPVLNLSQAVLILCYELALSRIRQLPPRPSTISQRERRQLFDQVERVLLSIGFLSSRDTERMMQKIEDFWGGPELTADGLKILRGIMSQMEWFAREGRLRDPESIRKP